MRRGLRHDAETELGGDPRGLGPDRRRGHPSAEGGERAGGGAGGEQHDIALRDMRRTNERGVVERHEVGAEAVDQRSARTAGGGDEHPAGRPRELLEQPLLRRDTGNEGRLDPV